MSLPADLCGFRRAPGTGIFNSDGDIWKFHRAMTRPFFTRHRIADFDIFDRHCELTLEKIDERCSTGQPIDFQDIVSRFTMDSATDFLFGVDVHSLSSPLPLPGSSPATISETNRFTAAFIRSLEAVATRVRWRGKGWQVNEFWKDKTTEDMKVLYEFIEPILDGALKEKAAKRERDEKVNVTTDEGAEGLAEVKETLLAHLVSVTDGERMAWTRTLNQPGLIPCVLQISNLFGTNCSTSSLPAAIRSVATGLLPHDTASIDALELFPDCRNLNICDLPSRP